MLTAVWLVAGGLVKAQSTTPSSIEASGVPPITASLAREIQPYNSIYGLPLAGWDPAKREIWLKGLSSVTWILPKTCWLLLDSGPQL